MSEIKNDEYNNSTFSDKNLINKILSANSLEDIKIAFETSGLKVTEEQVSNFKNILSNELHNLVQLKDSDLIEITGGNLDLAKSATKGFGQGGSFSLKTGAIFGFLFGATDALIGIKKGKVKTFEEALQKAFKTAALASGIASAVGAPVGAVGTILYDYSRN